MTNQSQTAGKNHCNDECFEVSMFYESVNVTATLPKQATDEWTTDGVAASASFGAARWTAFIGIFHKNDINLMKQTINITARHKKIPWMLLYYCSCKTELNTTDLSDYLKCLNWNPVSSF